MDPIYWVIIAALVVVALGYWLVAGRKVSGESGGESLDDDDQAPGDRPEEKQPARVPERAAEAAAGESPKEASTPGGEDRPKAKTDEADAAPSAAATEGDTEDDAGAERDGEEPATSPEPPEAAAEHPSSPAEPAAEDDETRAERRKAFRKGLKHTRGGFIAKLGSLLRGKKELDADILDEIEETLLTSDVGVQFTGKLKKALEETLSKNELADADAVWDFMREQSLSILSPPAAPLDIEQTRPFVIMVIGVNGVGKTTTIAKLASRYVKSGKKVVLAAGDTFRAAAVRQLEMWGDRVGAEVIKNEKQGADPSSVVFEAIKHAVDTDADVVIADTAGRLHTKTPLMDELKKVGRVMDKACAGAPHEVLLVLDANTGQNANLQVREFKEALEVTGLVLTKLDGTAKGGVILSICEEHGLPVRFIGVGERDDDLRRFRADDFVDVLFERDEAESESAA